MGRSAMAELPPQNTIANTFAKQWMVRSLPDDKDRLVTAKMSGLILLDHPICFVVFSLKAARTTIAVLSQP